MMIKRKDLTNRADKNIWITDDRISALISHSCQGIEQIDYHGAQPVSRNAKFLSHPAGVLKFELTILTDQKIVTIPLTWSNLSIQPCRIQSKLHWNSLQIILSVTTLQNSLFIFCRVKADKPLANLECLEFLVFWNRLSATTEVHGRRDWLPLQMIDKHSILLKATDNIHLSEWLKRKGDYQGDFLIPEGWRRLIFKKQVISGLAKFENVKPEYQDLPFKLYEADTWMLIGGENYERLPEQNSWVPFKANLIQNSSQAYHSPLFQVRFSYQSAETLTENSIKSRIIKRFFLQNKRYQALAKRVPQLNLQNYPAIEDFFKQTPLIVESAKVKDTGMTRACPGTYYWIWAWDNLVTAQPMFHWGDTLFLRKMVNFINTHRDVDSSIPGRWTRFFEPMDSRGHGAMDALFSELVLALFSETNDKKILRANYTLLIYVFQYLKSLTHPNGLFPSFGMYPDIPQKMGRTEDFYVAIDQGTWYTFCRNLEKMALVINDIPTAMQTREMAEKIQRSFLSTFWDEKQGFLCDSFHPQTKIQLKSYPIFSLLFFESPFG
ncbi:hypothetical protein JW964_11660, partial [candidate division KSB1 bacterium]|nr:hypothetical protein [candidate division KSB1 bacterium]